MHTPPLVRGSDELHSLNCRGKREDSDEHEDDEDEDEDGDEDEDLFINDSSPDGTYVCNNNNNNNNNKNNKW